MPLDVVSMLATGSHLQLNALSFELTLGVVCSKTGLAISIKILHGSKYFKPSVVDCVEQCGFFLIRNILSSMPSSTTINEMADFEIPIK